MSGLSAWRKPGGRTADSQRWPKLKESVEDDANSEGPPKMDKNGKLGGPGMVNFLTNGPNGASVRSLAKAQPLSRLTAMLGNQAQASLVDKTGLTGKYDFELEFTLNPGIPGSLPSPPPVRRIQPITPANQGRISSLPCRNSSV